MNRAERMKARKNGVDSLDELRRYARLGFEAIPPEDMERFKWHGVFYRKQTPGHFMMRIRIPNGVIASGQMDELGQIANTYCRGAAAITTRQQIQVQWLRVEDIPVVIDRIEGVGLSTRQTGHDSVRNVVGCPLAGICPDEIIDVEPLAKQISELIVGSRDFTNLPRKFNISITGNTTNGAHTEVNDIGFTPARLGEGRDERVGFNVNVGGALGSRGPEFAQPLDAFVTVDEVTGMCKAILELFRDHGSREKRNAARLKFLLRDWGLAKFREEAERYAGQQYPRAGHSLVTESRRDYVGVFPQRQEGYHWVGCTVPAGRFSGDQMREAARLAEKHGIGEARFTPSQDLLFPYVHESNLEALKREPLLRDLPYDPAPALRGTISCTGAEFCHLAVIETKDRAMALAEYVSKRLELAEPVSIHWSGCPNSCGQHQIADIGLQGCKARVNGETVDAVDIFVGGRLGADARMGRKVLSKVPCSELRETVLGLIPTHFPEKLAPTDVMPCTPGLAMAAAADRPAPPAAPGAAPTLEAMAVECVGDDGRPFIGGLTPGGNLLLTMLEQGADPTYDCMEGGCGTCAVKVVSGARVLTAPTTAEEEILGDRIEQGYRLACQAGAAAPVEAGPPFERDGAVEASVGR